ncbi:hypothetical protein TRIP_C90110 [Candidatus Zixiibacteriota bacterium]|nr:hypothetical protein TRIP_C90110 [candidate division Zixibacteria bacterium]
MGLKFYFFGRSRNRGKTALIYWQTNKIQAPQNEVQSGFGTKKEADFHLSRLIENIHNRLIDGPFAGFPLTHTVENHSYKAVLIFGRDRGEDLGEVEFGIEAVFESVAGRAEFAERGARAGRFQGVQAVGD